MATITKIEIVGFKAFPNEFTLDLQDGKNLLMYGENGSGKSSIYYALHALLQSVFKEDQGAKYFDVGDYNVENLVNIFRTEEAKSHTFSPYVKITLNNGHIWIIKEGGLQYEKGGNKIEIKKMNNYAVFINHSFISRFHAARNSEEIDLWNVFVKDILPFSVIIDEYKSMADFYFEIINEIPKGKAEIDAYKRKIKKFNENLYNNIIAKINKEAYKIYNDYFKNEDDSEINISLRYFADDDDKNNPLHEHFYLAYEKLNKTQYSIRYPKIGINILSSNISINKPQSYFNEAKLTAIALSVRFACLPTTVEEGAFMALDDMLISLDMSNRLKLLNYLLNEATKNYKLYVFTHDRLFYHTFKRIIETQYEKAKWVFGGLYLNDINTPITPEFKLDNKTKIKDVHEAYSVHDYFRCGTLLRQLCERKLKDLLPNSLQVKEDPTTKQTIQKNLDEMILSLEDFCKHENIDFGLFKMLKMYKDLFMNSTAHNDITSPFYRNEIKSCMTALEELEKINRSKRINCDKDVSFQILKPDGIHTIRMRLRENLLLLEYNSSVRISYYSKCTVLKEISSTGEVEHTEGYESVYEAYKKYGVPSTNNLLDILHDRDGSLRNKIQ